MTTMLMNRRPAAVPDASDAALLAEVHRFAASLHAMHRDARRGRRTVPTEAEKARLIAEFWALMYTLRAWEHETDPHLVPAMRRTTREILNPWLLRSDFWNRAWTKPHGYPGDFRMLEVMYDLEPYGCADPTQPLVVNTLNAVARTVHSVLRHLASPPVVSRCDRRRVARSPGAAAARARRRLRRRALPR